MLFRMMLVAMHWNENSGRKVAKTKEGESRFKVAYPKNQKGHATAKVVKEDATYGKLSWFMLILLS